MQKQHRSAINLTVKNHNIGNNHLEEVNQFSRDIYTEVEGEWISCYGDSCKSAHPCVYLSLKKQDKVSCPYCSKVFIKKVKS